MEETFLEQLVNWSEIPIWVTAIGFAFLMVAKGLKTIYNDIIKPVAEKKLGETDIKKFNEEEDRWNKVLTGIESLKDTVLVLAKSVEDLLTKEINHIDYTFAENIMRTILRSSAMKLERQIVRIFHYNDRFSPARTKHIKDRLCTHLKLDKQDIIRVLKDASYSNIRLSDYIETVTKEHTEEFLNLLYDKIFQEDHNDDKILDDLMTIIESHYDTHISEALEHLTKKK